MKRWIAVLLILCGVLSLDLWVARSWALAYELFPPAAAVAVVLTADVKCTGVIIAPRLVATADHCARITGSPQTILFSDGQRVEAIVVFEGSVQMDPILDVAFLLLPEPAVAIAKLGEQVPEVGSTLFLYRFADLRLERFPAVVEKRETLRNWVDSLWVLVDSSDAASFGTSGGPAVQDGIVVGIINWRGVEWRPEWALRRGILPIDQLRSALSTCGEICQK